MNKLGAATCVASVGAAWCVLAGFAGQPGLKKDMAAQNAAPGGIAVVELFTSEGCSSCPPADALGAKIAKEAKEKGENVFVLALHVDYWNHLGWKDPFAKAEFSARQREYAAALGKQGGDGGIYTPEMVVNGSVGFVGSDSDRAKGEIGKAIAGAPRVKIEPKIGARKAGEPVELSAAIAGDASGLVACAAIIEDGLRMSVKAGENMGRTLEHDRVVRVLGKQPIKDGTTVFSLKLPEGAKEANCQVVIFVQEEKTLKIMGAAEIGLQRPTK